ncbi:MAG: replication protein C [Sphingomonas sp.]|uniref:plasmid replication protein RepC n=1 Tax=Sphingomonas sp. TaxID=28214 RepID=UPI0035A853AA|nr:replication protein C [Sphingomonas sp.]
MAHALNPGAGLRRYDRAAADAAKLAREFSGLTSDRRPSHVLSAFKRAACYVGIKPTVVHLVDQLFAFTRAEDWSPLSEPIVWPTNEMLAQKLGIGVRHVQNLLDRAVAHGLISHKDSPSGKRGGVRGADGRIKWAYGIVLSPMGTRYAEFVEAAAKGAREDQQRTRLRERIMASRRRIRSAAQTAIDQQIDDVDAQTTLDVALLGERQVKKQRDLRVLEQFADEIGALADELEARLQVKLATMQPPPPVEDSINNSCLDDTDCIHSTTTTQPQTAKAVTRRGLARGRSDERGASSTSVELDLATHGVDPAFIEAVTPEISYTLQFESGDWGSIIALAERLVAQNAIHRHAWREACRLMGERGAAASVIATVYKYQAGEVRKPGAYLRGMSERAARGELHLGRTFHGFKDNARSTAMRGMHDGSAPSSFGELARRAIAGAHGLSGIASRA